MELQYLLTQLDDTYHGEPWFGRSATSLLNEVDQSTAVCKPNGQHSILELLWHMINWREFTISRLTNDNTHDISYYELNDWRDLDHQDTSLWAEALGRFQQAQMNLRTAIQTFPSDKLDTIVNGRTYNYRQLLNGIIQHDIYHLGQIAYVLKSCKHKK